MRRKRYTAEQIIKILKLAEAGQTEPRWSTACIRT